MLLKLAILAAAPGAVLAQLNCKFRWAAEAGDTCDSIAQYWGIELETFVAWNPSVGPGCANGVVPGTEYCVDADVIATTTSVPPSSTRTTATTTATLKPSPTQEGLVSNCNRFHKVVTGDTCDKIVRQYGGGLTLDLFYSWNPAVGSDCASLWRDYYVCVGVPGTATGSPTTTGTPAPSPTQAGLTQNCNKFYLVVSGDTCQKIVDKNAGAFSLEQFYSWNPATGQDCTGLWLGYYVCVGTTTFTPTTHPGTTPTGTPKPSPTQAGLAADCTKFYKVVSGDTCRLIVGQKYGNAFSLEQFYAWNPAVGSDCSSLWLGYYVCVGTPSNGGSPNPNPNPVPSPTQPGISPDCKEYYQVKSGDFCQKIVDSYGGRFSLQEFYSWNPAVGNDCASLWAEYYVCVRV